MPTTRTASAASRPAWTITWPSHSARKSCWPCCAAGCRRRRTGLLLDRFDLDQQLDVGFHAHLDAVVDAPLIALDRGLEIAAADFALQHRAVVAIEVGGLQGHRVALAEQGQGAADRADLVAV